MLSETGKVWLPNLPTHGLNVRAAAGSPMPAGYPACTVYFPGTYVDPLVLTGPTYFTSGIYYFENTVTIQNGADVVVGGGATPGCTSDQEAIFYATNVPEHTQHDWPGRHLGARASAARVVVTNGANAPALKLRFNARYVQAGQHG